MTRPAYQISDALDGYETRVKRLEDGLDRVSLDLARERRRSARLAVEAGRHQREATEWRAKARAFDAEIAGLGDDARRRHQAALDRSAADPGKREHAAVVRSTREAVESHEAITRRTP